MAENSRLGNIPPEILEHILTYVDEDPRTATDVYDQPTLNIVSSRYRHPPLKSLSRTCRGFRELLLPRLFKHMIQLITADDRNLEREQACPAYTEWPKSRFSALLDFIEEKQWGNRVLSFTLAIKDQPEFDEIEYYHEQRNEQAQEYGTRWARLLLAVLPNLERLTIVAPPTVLGMLTAVHILPGSMLGLHIPYQILSLHVAKHQNPPINHDSIVNDETPLFKLLPWSGITLNEGSFYRYHQNGSRSWQNNMFISDEFSNWALMNDYFPYVTMFSYIGICAPQLHLAHVVQFAASLPSLECFGFALQSTAPLLHDPDVSLTVNERSLAREMQISYAELIHTVENAEAHAENLGLEQCFEALFCIECFDSSDLVDFDKEEAPDGWVWSVDDPDRHVLYREL